MSHNYLNENHSFRTGDDVIFSERCYPNREFTGRIHSIVSLPINRGCPNGAYTDYFYISLSRNDCDTILTRGYEVIYSGNPITLGDVIKDNSGKIITINRQYHINQSIIDIQYVNAVLIWRQGYSIRGKP
jgi:hypothetical protein